MSKVTSSVQKFQPVTLTIILETKEEVSNLRQFCNYLVDEEYDRADDYIDINLIRQIGDLL